MGEPKQKIILSNQGQVADISIRELVVILSWTADVDLDLLAFYKTKVGRTGGVFSESYPGGNAGSLETFPFIELNCDAGGDSTGQEKEEILRISELADMAEIYIVAMNYTDAVAHKPSAFIDYDGDVVVINDKLEAIEVPLNSSKEGHAAVVCKIVHSLAEGAQLINMNQVLDFNEFMTTIPGAEMFVRLKFPT